MPSFFDAFGDPVLSPYTVLNLPVTATEADIKKAYRTQMLQLHPDKLSPTLDPAQIASITEKFHNVKDAYEFLTSPYYLTGRRLYQAKMASQRAEHERREAFLRKAQHFSGQSEVQSTRTRMSSYPVPPRGATNDAARMAGGTSRGRMNRSEPDFGIQRGKVPSRQKVTGQPKYYKSHTFHSRTMDRNPSSAAYNNTRTRGHNRNGRHGLDSNHRPKCTSAGPKPRSTTPAQKEFPSRGHHRYQKNGNSNKERMREKSRSRRRTRSEPRSSRPNKSKGYTSGGSSSGRDHPRRKSREPASGSSSNEPKSDDTGDRLRFENGKEKISSRRQYSNNHNNINNSRGDFQSSDGRNRSRARSAPARCYTSGKKRNSKGNIARSEKTSSHPKEFYCPLTKRIMKDPVSDSDGNVYEREAIERWLRVQRSSPITNGFLSLEMLKPNLELKLRIYNVVGKPRSKSQPRAQYSNTQHEYISGRILIDSYLGEISSKSSLSVSLDGMGICAFSYRKMTFVIEVPITPNAGFTVYSSFDTEARDHSKLSDKIDVWNKWLSNIGWASRVSHIKMGNKIVFTLMGSEKDMIRCDIFQKTLEYFVEMSLKLHNLFHPAAAKSIDNVCLTRDPVCVA